MHKNKIPSILILAVLPLNVKADGPPSEDLPTSSSQDLVSSFQPSLAVVIGVLCVMFSLTFLLLLYAKFFHRTSSYVHNLHIVRPVSRSPSGIDKTVVESLPFFRFSLLRGSKQGLECAVCLSKFEDIEILRLLPMCKHAFHIDCIDQWLEKHSTCPLCRHKISCQDFSMLTYSDSLRFLWSQSEELIRDEESNLELYIQREENGSEKEDLPIQEKTLHRFNHRIIVSDVVFKNRWSNVTSSDLIFLNSEMLNGMTSNIFSSMDRNTEQYSMARRVIEEGQTMNIKDEMERKRLFESKIKSKSLVAEPSTSSKVVSTNEKRSMSEIIVYPRFNNRNRELSVPEERRRKLWLPIARRTVKWFANREGRSPHKQNTTQTLYV